MKSRDNVNLLSDSEETGGLLASHQSDYGTLDRDETDNEEYYSSDEREKSQEPLESIESMSPEELKGLIAQTAINAMVWATAGVEVLVVGAELNWFDISQEKMEGCPLPNATISEKIDVIFFEKPGFLAFEIAGVGRLFAVPLGYMALSRLIQKINDKWTLTATGEELLYTFEKRVLSAILASTVLIQEESEMSRDWKNGLSVAVGLLPFFQFIGEFLDKKNVFGLAKRKWFEEIVKAVNIVGYVAGAGVVWHAATNTLINYCVNGSREVNWEHGPLTADLVGMGGIVLSGASVCISSDYFGKRKSMHKNLLSKFHEYSKVIYAIIGGFMISGFNFGVSSYTCWDTNRRNPENYGKGVDPYFYIGLVSFMFIMGTVLYRFMRGAEQVREQKKYQKLIEVAGDDFAQKNDESDRSHDVSDEEKKKPLLESSYEEEEDLDDRADDNEVQEKEEEETTEEIDVNSDKIDKNHEPLYVEFPPHLAALPIYVQFPLHLVVLPTLTLVQEESISIMKVMETIVLTRSDPELSVTPLTIDVNLPKLTELLVATTSNGGEKTFVRQRGFFSHAVANDNQNNEGLSFALLSNSRLNVGGE